MTVKGELPFCTIQLVGWNVSFTLRNVRYILSKPKATFSVQMSYSCCTVWYFLAIYGHRSGLWSSCPVSPIGLVMAPNVHLAYSNSCPKVQFTLQSILSVYFFCSVCSVFRNGTYLISTVMFLHWSASSLIYTAHVSVRRSRRYMHHFVQLVGFILQLVMWYVEGVEKSIWTTHTSIKPIAILQI